MNKGNLLYWIDIGMGISFLIVFITGLAKFRLFIDYFLWLYKIVPFKEITFIHDWSGIFMGIFVLIHLILHWRWIINMTKNLFRIKK